MDLSGQGGIGTDGWSVLCKEIKEAQEKGFPHLKLKVLVVAQCKLKPEAKIYLEDLEAVSTVKVECGTDQGDGRKRRKGFCC